MPGEPRISEEKGEAARAEVAILIAFEKTAGWKVFRKKLEEKRVEHTDALASRSLPPEKRAEHIEAYHDAVELLGWLPGRIKELEETVFLYNTQG